MLNFLKEKLLNWSIPILFLIFWYFGTLDADKYSLLPSPQGVYEAFIRLLLDGSLVEHITISSFRAIVGLIIGGGIGFLLGVFNGISPRCDSILNNPIQMIRNVPYIAMLPLILVWFGIGEGAKITIVAIGVFFPIYLNTYHGIKSVDKNLIEMGRVYGLKGLKLFYHVIFLGAAPSILVGLRQSLGRMWVTLIVAETIAAKSGIGFMVTNAREYMLMDVIVLGLVIYGLLGIFSDYIARLIERRVLRWQRARG
ncbi:MAG: ABC transporter permease subunit [Succinivibrionaceae bacterium]|nr:ABC transporter permease subunit [Succinivibrionaceae bacterium]